jgi:hypothetical protein
MQWTASRGGDAQRKDAPLVLRPTMDDPDRPIGTSVARGPAWTSPSIGAPGGGALHAGPWGERPGKEDWTTAPRIPLLNVKKLSERPRVASARVLCSGSSCAPLGRERGNF